jgi:hypothetical protein
MFWTFKLSFGVDTLAFFCLGDSFGSFFKKLGDFFFSTFIEKSSRPSEFQRDPYLFFELKSLIGATTFSLTTLSIMTFSIMAFSIMAFSIMAFSIMTLGLQHSDKQHSA